MAAQTTLRAAAGGSVTLKPDDTLTTDEEVVFSKGGFLGGLGMTGETWVDETANRQLDVEYTNDTGKPIMVALNINGGGELAFYIDGVAVITGYEEITGINYPIECIVTAGSTYKLMGEGNSSINKWAELK